MKEFFVILLTAIIIENFVLQQFLGICPFLGVSKKIKGALGMGIAVIFVMVCASAITWPIYTYILVPKGIDYLRTVVFILIIALFVQIVEMVIKKIMPPLYKALGVYLPLITTNCAVLGVTVANVDNELNFVNSIANALGGGLGFLLALLLFSGVRSRIQNNDIPAMFKGVPATLIAASIVALSFGGFSGII